jgi:hypothetical protein
LTGAKLPENPGDGLAEFIGGLRVEQPAGSFPLFGFGCISHLIHYFLSPKKAKIAILVRSKT